MELLHAFFHKSPIIALFLSLAIGYGDTDDLGEGQWHAFRDVTSRVYWVQQGVGESLTIASLEESFHGNVIVKRVVRDSRQLGVSPTLALEKGDRVALTGKREPVVKAGTMLGPESGNLTGMSFVEKHRDVVITRKDLVGITLRELKENSVSAAAA